MRQDTPCSVGGCDRLAEKRGWCGMHYMRWYLHGDVGEAAPQRYFDREVGFWAKVNRNGPVPLGSPELGPCWLWTGALSNGYGAFGGTGSRLAHRIAYEELVGPISDGLGLDHLCHNSDLSCEGGSTCVHRSCVNPKHVEPVTTGENLLRSPLTETSRNAARTHCPQGHEYTEENTVYGPGRKCRQCLRLRRNAYYRRRKAG